MTVDGSAYQVIGNLGYNPAAAIQQGSYAGYAEERAAIEAGASFSGEGTDSAYLSAILDGSGVGLSDPHVTAEQQGQFADLYQKLGIIPTWTNNTVQITTGVAALTGSAASTLATENYLVQLAGYFRRWRRVRIIIDRMATAEVVGPIPAGGLCRRHQIP